MWQKYAIKLAFWLAKKVYSYATKSEGLELHSDLSALRHATTEQKLNALKIATETQIEQLAKSLDLNVKVDVEIDYNEK